MEETLIKGEESIKISRGMTGKYSYEIKLLGNPEDNKERIIALKKEYDKIINTDTETPTE